MSKRSTSEGTPLNWTRPLVIGFFLAGLCGVATTVRGAQIGTYVDASKSTNTTPSSAFTTSYVGSGSDGLWDDRPLTGFGLLNDNVLEAGIGEQTSPNVPVITTTVNGLSAGTYDVYVSYWIATTSDFKLAAGLNGGPQSVFDKTTGIDTGIFSPSAPAFRLRQGYLGSFTGTSFNVNIDSPVGASDRTWYEGVSYIAPGPRTEVRFDHNNFDSSPAEPLTPTQNGYTGIDDGGGAVAATPYSVTGSGVTMTVTPPASGDFDRDRGVTGLLVGNPLADMLRDFIFTTTGPIAIDLTGLLPGMAYTLTLYSYDNSFSNGAITAWFHDSTAPANLLGNVVNNLADPNSSHLTTVFNADGTGAIHLLAARSTGGTIAFFNGLDVVIAPEPASACLLAVGIVLVRRRR